MGDAARGYSWPAFEPGNTVGQRFEPGNEAAVTHGARSPRVVAPLAERFLEHVLEVAPWTSGRAFAGTRAAWAWAEAQCELLRRYLDEVGLIDGDDVRPVANYLDRVERRAASLRRDLGLDPQAAVKLLGGMSVLTSAPEGTSDGMEALKAEGLAMIEAAHGAAAEATS